MKFRDLGAQYNRLKEEIDKRISKSFQMGILLGNTDRRTGRTVGGICWSKALYYMCEWNRCFNNGINGMEYSERRRRICARFYIFCFR